MRTHKNTTSHPHAATPPLRTLARGSPSAQDGALAPTKTPSPSSVRYAVQPAAPSDAPPAHLSVAQQCRRAAAPDDAVHNAPLSRLVRSQPL
ncbi:uncharacterized protein TRAVEDRAFT_32203 [Trametes versicolor FP-101664 SS1]|uniref:Uncharacterized protein n=1 Tax=Trametes versicolor (strain FP-101664) TaxID=717944 RepID=R7SAY5_TRAVS|nr:uncharacterized protein TRAVEDRAFT_32203 [Trametes versicolor FP-101664 SS1]EIW52074.1 hypothetical protein TRAVEDRAFT_32203 [Trametes versicolor FP-101664 SS1]